MARQRIGRIGTALALLIALGGALLVGGLLASADPLSSQVAQAAPTVSHPNRQRTAAAFTVASPAVTAAISTFANVHTAPPTATRGALTATPTAALTTVVPAPTPTAIPTLAAWTVVGRWQANQLIITEPFTTNGPWRICWSLPDARVPFQVMVGNPEQTAWDLLSAPTGVTIGAFDLPQAGSYRLMFHSETAYTALVIAHPGGNSSGSGSPPPCG